MMTTNDLARLGATVRLAELMAEAAQLRQAFPELATPDVAAPPPRGAGDREKTPTTIDRRATEGDRPTDESLLGRAA